MPAAPRRRARSAPARTVIRTVFAALAVAGALLTGCTSTIDGNGTATNIPGFGSAGPSGTGTVPTQPAGHFIDCSKALPLNALNFPPGRLAQLTFTCTLVTVPLDYAAPDGRTINLVVLRVHDVRDTHPTGQLLINPGGPGGSGLLFTAEISPQMPQTVLDHFDLIGFDPRGVGQSTPIRCLSDAREDQIDAASPDVLTTTGFARAAALSASVDHACRRKYGTALQYFTTVDTARDMDRIRQAVGDPSMNYLGFSYGTELGSVYAHLFPQRVRAMVLDGAIDPLAGPTASTALQLKGFEGAFDQFAAYCRRTAPCSSIGNPRKAVYAIQAAATRSPLEVPGQARTLTFSLATTGVLQALYKRSDWPTLGSALIGALRGNGSGLLALADTYYERDTDGEHSNVADANLTITCNDTNSDPSDAAVRATAKVWARRYPMFGLADAPGLLSCRAWQPHRTPVPLPRARTPHTVLVVGNLHDPATPYKGAVDLARTMGNAQVLGWDGEGHTSYLEGSSCVDGYVNDYLVHGTLPPEGRLCPP